MILPTSGWYWVRTKLSGEKWIAMAFVPHLDHAFYLGASNGTHAGKVELDQIVEVGSEVLAPEGKPA